MLAGAFLFFWAFFNGAKTLTDTRKPVETIISATGVLLGLAVFHFAHGNRYLI